jgi:acetyl/propionyl-CoA carboxylase alpha subunit
MKYITTVNECDYEIDILDEHHVIVNGIAHEMDFEPVGNQPVYSLILDGQSYEAHIYPDNGDWQVLLHGTLYPVEVEDDRERRLRSAMSRGKAQFGEYQLKAPMPGLVVSIPVIEGQAVEKGDVLLILESMKMQNELKAPHKGTVTHIRVSLSERVEQKQTLLSVG